MMENTLLGKAQLLVPICRRQNARSGSALNGESFSLRACI